ncbi:MAG: hypothetical protein AAFV78_01165 [Bacteroidota bacterium]
MKKVFNQTLLIFAIIVATIYIDRNFLIPHDILKPQPVAMVGSGIQPMGKSHSIQSGKQKIMLTTKNGEEFMNADDFVVGELKDRKLKITTISGDEYHVVQASLTNLEKALEKFDLSIFQINHK